MDVVKTVAEKILMAETPERVEEIFNNEMPALSIEERAGVLDKVELEFVTMAKEEVETYERQGVSFSGGASREAARDNALAIEMLNRAHANCLTLHYLQQAKGKGLHPFLKEWATNISLLSEGQYNSVDGQAVAVEGAFKKTFTPVMPVRENPFRQNNGSGGTAPKVG